MSRLTRDGTTEPVSRDQILRHAGDRGIFIFSVQLTTTSRIGDLTQLIHTLLYDDHTYIHTYISTTVLLGRTTSAAGGLLLRGELPRTSHYTLL